MLRYFEYGGVVRRALSVVKKRSGNHEHTIREFRLTSKESTSVRRSPSSAASSQARPAIRATALRSMREDGRADD